MGIDFSLKIKHRTEKNWTKILGKIKAKIQPFNLRTMTILGKVTVINSHVISMILYLGRIIPPTIGHLKKINQIIQSFIAYEKPQGYTVHQLERPQRQGGFGLPNVQNKLKAVSLIWLKYLVMKKSMKNYWTELFNLQIRQGPKKGQNCIHHHILAKKGKDKIIWEDMSLSYLYQNYMNEVAKNKREYPVERALHTLYIEGGIWENWYRTNINNIVKIQIHRIISDTYNDKKIVNRSGNCSMCDMPFILSRDHVFLNCKGAKLLQTYINTHEGIKLDNNILYHKFTDEKNKRTAYIYMYTIIKLREQQQGKWGTPDPHKIQNTYKMNKQFFYD